LAISETLFLPLAGPKKHVYARLLLLFHSRVFAPRILEIPVGAFGGSRDVGPYRV
jgi:hypothetical protein